MADRPLPNDEELVIRTARLVLRPVRTDDAPLLFDHCSDPRLSRLMAWAPHREVGETKTFLAACVEGRRAGRGWVWAIWEEGQFRGVVGIESVLRNLLAVRVDRAELGYWLGLPFHGRGLMTEAAGAATGFAFARLGLHKVIVRALAQNAASLGVIRKLGFREVGVARSDVWKDGAWHDHVAFEMLADDPAAQRLVGALR
jgi:RimJ/RimL family protein N-acetyltransferase